MEGALSLGLIECAECSVVRFQLKEGNRLILMSDPVAETTDPDGHLFGFERVHEMLRTTKSVADIASAALTFGQGDDIDVISVTRTAMSESAAAGGSRVAVALVSYASNTVQRDTVPEIGFCRDCRPNTLNPQNRLA
jgi:hypothetical protein